MRKVIRALTLSVAMTMALSVVASPSLAAPALENCEKLSQRCLDADSTRMINGLPVHAACWQWEVIHECDRANPINQCAAFDTDFAKRHKCNKQKSTRTGTAEHGLSPAVIEEWRCDDKNWSVRANKHKPQQKLIVENDDFITKKAKADGATLKGIPAFDLLRHDTSDPASGPKWNAIQAICGQASPVCKLKTTTCLKPEASAQIDVGFGNKATASEACWRSESTYDCPSGKSVDDCAKYRNDETCRKTSTECLSKNGKGGCLHSIVEYQCGGTGTESTITKDCGSQNWCIGKDCTAAPLAAANTGFSKAASTMSLLQEMAKDFETNGNKVTIFKGRKKSCSKWVLGLKNCCKSKGALLDLDLAECSENEKKLAVQRSAGQAYYTSSSCGQKSFFGSCLVRKSHFCTFNSRLGRMIQEQGRKQLGIGWGNCRGLTPEELQKIDWSQINLDEVIADIEGQMKLPKTQDLKKDLERRVKDFYKRNKPSNKPPNKPGDNSTEDNQTDDRGKDGESDNQTGGSE